MKSVLHENKFCAFFALETKKHGINSDFGELSKIKHG
jgi:hypothetical protein